MYYYVRGSTSPKSRALSKSISVVRAGAGVLILSRNAACSGPAAGGGCSSFSASSASKQGALSKDRTGQDCRTSHHATMRRGAAVAAINRESVLQSSAALRSYYSSFSSSFFLLPLLLLLVVVQWSITIV